MLEDVVKGPLPADWQGFPLAFAELLKGTSVTRLLLLYPMSLDLFVYCLVFYVWCFVLLGLLASYADISYLGTPEYICRYCGASFWYEERVKAKSSYAKRRIVYNLCCKGGQVYIPPFKEPPAFFRGASPF